MYGPAPAQCVSGSAGPGGRPWWCAGFRERAEQVVLLNTAPRRVTRTYRAHGLTVVELHGDIDIATTDEARRHLGSVTTRPAVGLLLDLRPVTFFDCSGVRLLSFAQRRTLERRGRLYLVCDAPPDSAPAGHHRSAVPFPARRVHPPGSDGHGCATAPRSARFVTGCTVHMP
ncbi:STAS domain-containing protein [Streptomyces chrestomyceticus]|uniref:STAS domain-containing protein n=1 Tax=Streptomyces chrestomyceticus TaxID=68185 RepID=UPI0027DD52F6|nr:STAS domain-containing protein [Streptomyces chrestomyceticus]